MNSAAQFTSTKGAPGQVRVFIVEDDAILVMALEDILEDLGHVTAASATGLDVATSLAETVDCNLAILDVNVRGARVDPVADILSRRRVPIIFATGYHDNRLRPEHAQWPVVSKPYSADEIEAAIRAAFLTFG